MQRRSFPQLDGLRGLAALIVLIHHFWPASTRLDPTGGRIGVDFFFVLSGFLITRSLLQDRQAETESPWPRIQRFYVRRLWRILPLFYVTCLTAALMGGLTRESGLFWHLSFLSNLFYILHGGYVGSASHLWAVAVEQHFYLFWPWVLLLLPRKHLTSGALGLVLLGITSRIVAGILDWPSITIDVMTPAAFESLGVGALLALAPEGGADGNWSNLRLRWLAGGGLALMAAQWIFRGTLIGQGLGLTATDLARSLLLAWLIARAATGFEHWPGTWLGSAAARALGRWSFAVYLMHNFVLQGVKARYTGWLPGPALPWIATAVTIPLAALGYALIEAPLVERRHRARPQAASANALAPGCRPGL